MNQGPFTNLAGLCYYNEPATYIHMTENIWAWEFNGWKQESLSWKTGCYMDAGLFRKRDSFHGHRCR